MHATGIAVSSSKNHGSSLLSVAHALHEGAYEAVTPDDEREAAYRARNLPFLAARLVKRLGDLHPPHEAALVRRAASAPQYAQCAPVRALDAAADLLAKGRAVPTATLGAEEISNILHGRALPPDDAFGRCAAAVFADYHERRDAERALLSERDELLAKLLELQRTHASAGEKFYPDANGCLRLSAGHVEGTPPPTVSHHSPPSARREGGGGGGGAKAAAATPTAAVRPAAPASTRRRRDCSRSAKRRRAGGVDPGQPAVLDGRGGRQLGLAVLDADGRFVMINFDRQRQGLMNEYKWLSYSARSASTWACWLVGSYDGATPRGGELCAA